MNDFDALLKQNYGPLERFVRFRMEGTGDAEDLLQEICLAAWRNFPTLRDPEKFKPWLLQIARNQCRNYYAARKPAPVSLEAAGDWLAAEQAATHGVWPSVTAAHAAPTTPAWPLEADTPAMAVHDTLDQLVARDREILELSYFVRLPQAAIAEQLRIPLGTVKSRMHTAKARFRSLYPYPQKGENEMKDLPEIMPAYTIQADGRLPFPVKWEETMGWFIVPKEGETCRWAMYDFPARTRTMTVELAVEGKAKVHGIEGVRIRSVEHDPAPSEQIGDQQDVERFFVAQLTPTHCRLLAESHTAEDGTREYYTFLDGDDFLDNWGFGPDNCGNETDLRAKGLIRQEETPAGPVITAARSGWPLDVVGRYTVTINGKSYDTVCLWDIECYAQDGTASQQFLDQSGRTILWRRFNRDDWAQADFKKPWTELLPENERVTINGRTYVHWYDCITDYIL